MIRIIRSSSPFYHFFTLKFTVLRGHGICNCYIMKKQLFILYVIFLIASCNQQGTLGTSDSPDSTASVAPIVRDMSITPENAYNNLFLDSNAVETYIKNKNLPGNEAAELRNFYNSRNFEYAWFAGEGLTQEARNF